MLNVLQEAADRIAELTADNESLIAQNASLLDQLKALALENKLLDQKVRLLLERMFGRKSEKIDPNQLMLMLGDMADPEPDEPDDPPPTPPRRGNKRRKRRPRFPSDLPVEEEVIEPEEVLRDPEGYRRIGQEVCEELDLIPTRYFLRRTIRPRYVSRTDRTRPPVIAPLPPRLIEGGYASVGLVSDVVLQKYEDHLPLCRQERILKTRYGIELSRQTLSEWVRMVAQWLKPLYNHIADELRRTGYLQVDETPIRYLGADGGGSAQGYLWVYHHPGGSVLYQWHCSRAATCLDGILKDYKGTVQCDGYAAYSSYAKSHPDIDLAACWAHARRKFHEALQEEPALAGWFLAQIGLLYDIERRARSQGSRLRAALRSSASAMILARLEKALRLKLPAHLPRSQMGKAIGYTLGLWPQLLRFRDHGELRIDNNAVENTIRPTAVGKKNYLFFGAPDAGERSAIIYTILESCKRHGIQPREYLHDVLSRLPAMKITELAALTPARWAQARKRPAA